MPRETMHGFPRIHLADLRPEDVPPQVADCLFVKSTLYDDPGLAVEAFDELLTATHPVGVTSFIARQNRTYPSGQTERIFHVVDALPHGEVVGYAELAFALNTSLSLFKDKPFVAQLSTEPAFQGTRQGNLAGRLLVLREIAEKRIGFPLYSDILVSSAAVRVMKHLVRLGLAEEIQDGTFRRYRSIPTPS